MTHSGRHLAVAMACVLWAEPIGVSAHAVLIDSDPMAGSRVDRAPQTVTLTFDEPVETSVGSLRVFDANGVSHASGPVFHPDGDAHRIATRVKGMGRGAFVVSWQVVSADSHIVDGAFAFGFGVAAGAAPVHDRDPGAQALLMAVRWLMLAGALVGIGLAIVAALPGIRMRASARAGELLAWIVLAMFAFADVLLRADIISGSPAAIFATRVGMLRAITILAALGAVGAVMGKRRQILLLAAAIVAAASLSAAGHAAAGTGIALGFGADLLHLFGAAAWIGALAICLAADSDADIRLIAPVAAVAVATLAGTGIVQTIRNVGSWTALFSTTYGFAIDLKIGLLALALAAALAVRRSLGGALRRTHNRLGLESLVLTGIIAVTAVLVETPLPREAAALISASTSFTVSDVTVHVSAVQTDSLHWALHINGRGARGQRRALDAASVMLRDTERASGPLVVPLTRDASGAFAGEAALPWHGSWRALVSARIGDFDENHRTLPLGDKSL